jgi:hypothetical protein
MAAMTMSAMLALERRLSAVMFLKNFIYQFCLAKNLATMAPLMLCHTLKMAPGMVARGYKAKWVAARLLAKPEFCMPTSIDIALRLARGMCSSLLTV